VILILKNFLSHWQYRIHTWLTFRKFHIALAAICIACVFLTCLLSLVVIGGLQQRDAIADAEGKLNQTLDTVSLLIAAGDFNLVCSDTSNAADFSAAFVSFKGAKNCTVPSRKTYVAVAGKATEGDINPYDQSYTIRWNGQLFRMKSTNLTRLKEPMLVTAGEPIWLLSDRLIRLGSMAWIGVLLLAIVGGLISTAAVRKHLRPLTIMSKEIAKIHVLHKQAKLGHKLSLTANTTELNSVATAFNDLLETLEANLVKYHEFASNAAHEIRTALMVISSIAQRSILQSSSGIKANTAMADILDEVDHINRLTQGLLTLAQLENRSKEIDVSPELLQPLVEQCVDTMTALAEDMGHTLLMTSFAHTQVWINLTMFRQALMNLIHNAIVHCDHGATISVVLSSKQPNTTTIAICDDGKGIPLDRQERIFDRFATVSRVTNRQATVPPHRGLGLGLSIARALVEAQGGTLTLESELSRGSKFFINIPTAGA
jgi:signal transduction histidine kinase